MHEQINTAQTSIQKISYNRKTLTGTIFMLYFDTVNTLCWYFFFGYFYLRRKDTFWIHDLYSKWSIVTVWCCYFLCKLSEYFLLPLKMTVSWGSPACITADVCWCWQLEECIDRLSAELAKRKPAMLLHAERIQHLQHVLTDQSVLTTVQWTGLTPASSDGTCWWFGLLLICLDHISYNNIMMGLKCGYENCLSAHS